MTLDIMKRQYYEMIGILLAEGLKSKKLMYCG